MQAAAIKVLAIGIAVSIAATALLLWWLSSAPAKPARLARDDWKRWNTYAAAIQADYTDEVARIVKCSQKPRNRRGLRCGGRYPIELQRTRYDFTPSDLQADLKRHSPCFDALDALGDADLELYAALGDLKLHVKHGSGTESGDLVADVQRWTRGFQSAVDRVARACAPT